MSPDGTRQLTWSGDAGRMVTGVLTILATVGVLAFLGSSLDLNASLFVWLVVLVTINFLKEWVARRVRLGLSDPYLGFSLMLGVATIIFLFLGGVEWVSSSLRLGGCSFCHFKAWAALGFWGALSAFFLSLGSVLGEDRERKRG